VNKVSFVNLKVYDVAEQLGNRTWAVVLAWPAFARDTIGKQLVKAVDSIGANIAEGIGRYSLIEARRFSLIARGSLYETRHWLRQASQRGLLRETETAVLSPLVDQLSALRAGYIRSLNKRTNASAAKSQAVPTNDER